MMAFNITLAAAAIEVANDEVGGTALAALKDCYPELSFLFEKLNRDAHTISEQADALAKADLELEDLRWRSNDG